jgi:hypothetical protein
MSRTLPTDVDRALGISTLINHLTGDHPENTPGEILRCASYVGGWQVMHSTSGGGWTVEGRSMRLTHNVHRDVVIAYLRAHWIEPARAALDALAAGAVDTAPVTPVETFQP